MVSEVRLQASRAMLAALIVAVAALGAACQPGTPSATATSWSIDPQSTDDQLATDLISPNLAHLPTSAALGRLAVILPGTSAGTANFGELTSTMRQAGYHVIVLRYSNALGTSAACPDAGALTDPDCFRSFRSEVTFGAGIQDPEGGTHDHPIATVSVSSSVLNRLMKLLDRLHVIAPAAGWDQFQQRTGGACDVVDPTYGGCALNWGSVTVIGHSQGSGVGLYLAKFFPIERLVMLSGSYDAYSLGGGSFLPASWITEAPLAIAPSSVHTFFHTSDQNLLRIRAVADAVGVPGVEVSVTGAPPPYGGTNRLVTSVAATCPWDSSASHNSTAVDICTPDLAYVDAWTTLATG